MDSKNYHECGFDSRQFLEHYASDSPDMAFEEDFLISPIESLRKTFIQGHINGDFLIDLSVGPLVHQLFAACEFFKHIIVLKFTDRCIMELKRWVDERTGAFHWGHVTKLHVDKEEESDKLQEKEEKMRSALQHVVKCDLEKENMMDPIVLPPADCIICGWLLNNISKNQDDYIRYLRKFSKLLKPGGHFILLECLGTTYYTVGREKLFILICDEDFIRKALVEAGFVIDRCEVKKRTSESDLIDYKAIIFIAGHKEN
ncbi:nicotinamide N-methyltransferase-like [Anomaloglossus baeobatrachus]|uniref:nicotinamide N-methyltransferase-like n=1 Tax=Anomaloglossus baeobatrachus TaxID=238106 RepID=UPI003F4FDDE9